MKPWQQRAFLAYDRLRGDGFRDHAFAMFERNSCERPKPPPRPMVGQVWVDTNIEVYDIATQQYVMDTSGTDADVNESLIVFVSAKRDGTYAYRLFCDVGGTRTHPTNERTEWPPPGAILVAGPGAPWGRFDDDKHDAKGESTP